MRPGKKILEKTDKSAELFSAKGTQAGPSRPFQADILSQVIERAALGLKNGQTSIRINLKPEELGQLRMQVKIENNQVMIKILAETPLVKDIIETNVGQLRAELQNQGLQIEKFDVSVDQGHHQNQRALKDFRSMNATEFEDDEGRGGDHLKEINKTTTVSPKEKADYLVDYFV